MDRIDRRPEKTDRDGLYLELLQPPEDPDCGVLIQRLYDPSVRPHPLRQLERQRPRNIGFREGDHKVEGLDAAPFAEDQDIGVPSGGQKSGLRRVPGDNGIDGVSGPMDEDVSPPEQTLRCHGQAVRRRPHRIQDSFDRVVGRRGGLEHVEGALRILKDQVGECAPRIYGEPHGCLPLVRIPHCPDATPLLSMTNNIPGSLWRDSRRILLPRNPSRPEQRISGAGIWNL